MESDQKDPLETNVYRYAVPGTLWQIGGKLDVLDGVETNITLTSKHFSVELSIPTEHTCYGSGISPPLSWTGSPKNTTSFVLIVDTLNATKSSEQTLWVLYNVPGEIRHIPENTVASHELKKIGTQGRNSSGRKGWQSPCPSEDAMTKESYIFNLYALDTIIDIGVDGAHKDSVMKAIQGHVIGHGELLGRFCQPDTPRALTASDGRCHK